MKCYAASMRSGVPHIRAKSPGMISRASYRGKAYPERKQGVHA